MSIFTRIFVVLVMLLSVLLVALVVPYVVNSDNFKGKWEDERTRRIVAEVNAQMAEARVTETMQALNTEISNRDEQLQALGAQISQKDIKLGDQQAQIIQLQNLNADVRQQLATLASASDQNAKLLEVASSEVTDRREKMLRLQQKNIEVADALRSKIVESETLDRQVRLLKEQQTDLLKQNENLEQRATTGTAPGTAAGAPSVGFESSTAIRGVVTDIQKINDETFVAINVGSNDKVQTGTRFMIHRGNEFLGSAVIMKVDLNSSAGRVTLQRGEISRDDEALSGGLP